MSCQPRPLNTQQEDQSGCRQKSPCFLLLGSCQNRHKDHCRYQNFIPSLYIGADKTVRRWRRASIFSLALYMGADKTDRRRRRASIFSLFLYIGTDKTVKSKTKSEFSLARVRRGARNISIPTGPTRRQKSWCNMSRSTCLS